MTSRSVLVENLTFTGSPKQPGADNHAHVVAQNDTEYLRCTFNANGASEALKASLKWDIDVTECVLTRGVEDAADHVRGGRISYTRCQFQGRGRMLTLKGGLRTVNLLGNHNLQLVVLGDYTKYDAHAVYPDGRVVKAGPLTFARPPVREVLIAPPLGEKAPWCICLHSTKPMGRARVIKVPSCLVSLYFWLRASLFKETNPPKPEDFHLLPEEL